MIKNLSKLFIIISLISLRFFSFSFAATLQVTKIGALDLGGKVYNEWWYTGTSPTFYGTASPNTQITIKVGSDSFNVTSDTTGAWAYPTTLLAGDYDVSFTSAAETVAFKLHLGQNLPDTSSSQAQTSGTPVTGQEQMLALALGIGIVLLATYFYISGDPRRKSIFEAKILKED